jgi:hypothetical protein
MRGEKRYFIGIVTAFFMLFTVLLQAQVAPDSATTQVSIPVISSEVPQPIREIIVDTIGGIVYREQDIRAGLLYDAERGAVVCRRICIMLIRLHHSPR